MTEGISPQPGPEATGAALDSAAQTTDEAIIGEYREIVDSGSAPALVTDLAERVRDHLATHGTSGGVIGEREE